MHEQTIWLAPRTIAFTEVCELCEEELEGALHVSVRGALALQERRGWATCPHGHRIQVLRMSSRMPAGALA